MKTLLFTLLLVSLTSFAFAVGAKKQVIVRLTAPSGNSDVTTVYFDFGITPAFVGGEDATKIFSHIAGVPSIYSFSANNVACSDNGFSSLATSAVIELGIRVDAAGGYAFTPAMLSNFDSSTIIQLEDRQENVFIDLRANFYAIQLNDTGIINGRFFLHITSPIQVSVITAGCLNNDGALEINQDSTLVWSSANLYDSSQTLVAGFNSISGTFRFSSLAEGDYTLNLFYNGYYVTSKLLHVNGNYIVAHIEPLTLTASVNEDIMFHTIEHNATSYFWDFGDGSQITGVANPNFTFLQPGVFIVLLICKNAAGCQYSDSVTVAVGNATAINNIASNGRNVWAYAKTVTVSLNEDLKPGAEIKVYNIKGQVVYTGPITQSTSSVSLNNETDGYYVVSVLNNDAVSNKSILLVK